MQVGFRTVDGVRVRCAESTGRSAPSILLTNPWPESVYAFAPIWPSLAHVFLDEHPPNGKLAVLDAGHFVWGGAAR